VSTKTENDTIVMWHWLMGSPPISLFENHGGVNDTL